MGETTETRTVKRKQSVENQDKRLPSKHKEPEKQSDYGGGDASKSSTADSPTAKEDSPPNQSNDEDFQQVESQKNKDKQKKPTQMSPEGSKEGSPEGSPEGSKEGSPEGSKEAGVMNEQQTSSNQSDKCTKDEANSQPFVDQSQVSTDDPTDKSNTRQEETKNENTEKQSQPPQL
ncbi:unnamed protein product [Oncorhynchus mykiss]|uniref:Uncharacterized protein n=1 Tax=Oncorhynchus mykiss TaxID=8022 RepID=A0A060Z2P4_ONCMY|nr:unnamed protein product [Oncorhynchus mykiss]